MKYVGDQITECRRDTNNTDTSSTTGIDTEDFLRYLNYGQENLQGLILQTNPATFQSQQIISLVANQEAYSIPDNVYLGERIVQVEFSYDGTVRNYYKLPEYSLNNRNTYPTASWPSAYIRRSGQILMVPTPATTQGTLRVTYERQLDRLDIRRGVISAVTGLTTTTVASITIDSTADEASSPINLTNATYICLNDVYGNVKQYGIPVGNYNSGSNVLTPKTSFAFDTALSTSTVNGNQVGVTTITVTTSSPFVVGDDIEFIDRITGLFVLRTVTTVGATTIGISGAAVNVDTLDLLYRNPTVRIGDYVTVGQYSTTHSKLKDPCERYLQAYCNFTILGRDSATGGSTGKAAYYIAAMETMKDELIRSYQEADKDGGDINIVNNELMLSRW